MDILPKDILESNKKTELYKMAKEFGIEKISKLKKEELLNLVCSYLLNPDQMKKCLLNTVEQDFELFCRVADGEQILIHTNTETLLFQRGYVFEDKEHRFVIPYDGRYRSVSYYCRNCTLLKIKRIEYTCSASQ